MRPKKNIFYIIVVLFLLLPPGYLMRVDFVKRAFEILQILILLYYVILMVRGKKKPDGIVIGILLIMLEIFMATIFTSKDIVGYFRYFASVLALCLFASFNMQKNADLFIEGTSIICHIYMVINTLTLFLFPNAMYANNRGIMTCWFLGEDNVGLTFYMLANFLALVLVARNMKRAILLFGFSVGNTLLFVLKNNIATGKVCIIIFLVLAILAKFYKKITLVNFKALIGIEFGILFILMVSQLNSSIYVFIQTHFGKSTALSGRTLIWERVLQLIAKHPVVGNGYYRETLFSETVRLPGLTNTHNYFLQLTFWGGLLSVSVLIGMFFYLDSRFRAEDRDSLYIVFLLSFLTYIIREQVESGYGQIIFFLLILIFYQKNISIKKEYQYRIKRRRRKIKLF